MFNSAPSAGKQIYCEFSVTNSPYNSWNMTLLFTLEQPINQAAGQFPQSRLCIDVI